MRSLTVHYGPGVDQPACGTSARVTTACTGAVSCERCRKTEDFSSAKWSADFFIETDEVVIEVG